MSNTGKIWDTREVYKQIRNNDWSRGDIGVSSDSQSATFNKVQISTTGNAVAFGDLNTSDYNGGGVAGSETRVVHGGGNQPSFSNAISYKEFSHSGTFSDFGDLTTARQMLTGASNGSMGVFAGGRTPSNSDVIDRISFSSLGNAVDFGDLVTARFAAGGISSPTRAVFAGGGAPSNIIDFIDFASFGNATDFGDIGTSSYYNYFAGSSSETRGVFGGGGNPSNTSIINFVTMASTGDSTDFGDLTVNRITMSGAGNSNRVCFFSGQQNDPSGSSTNVIDFVTITTTGDATDFGDATGNLGFKTGGGSNGHGGIKLDNFQRPSVTYMPGSGRALMSGGQTAPADALVSTVEMCHIPTAGNLSNFGDLASVTSNMPGNAASVIRSIVYSGYSPASPYYNNTIQCKEFATLGNYFDFGDPTQQRYALSSGNVGSPTRGVFMGGYAPGSPYYVNIIDYVTIASIGNGTDFGDLATATNNAVSCGSSTRGVCLGGYTGSQDDTIQYVTIASTGNATDFGNLTAAKSGGTGVSSSTRGIMAGGTTGSIINVIEYITIASTGDGTDFGDLTQARKSLASGSNSTRGVFMGGSTPSKVNTVDFITIATTGDATDFGDVSIAKRESAGTCDAHGGLQ